MWQKQKRGLSPVSWKMRMRYVVTLCAPCYSKPLRTTGGRLSESRRFTFGQKTRFGGDIGGRRSMSSSPTFPLRLQRVQPPLRSHHSFRHKWQGGEGPDSGHRWLGVVPTHLLRRLLLRRCWGSLCLKCSLVEWGSTWQWIYGVFLFYKFWIVIGKCV